MIDRTERSRIESAPQPSLREKVRNIGSERTPETKTAKRFNLVREKIDSFIEKVKDGTKGLKSATELGAGAMSHSHVDHMAEKSIQKGIRILEVLENSVQQVKENLEGKVRERVRNFMYGEDSGSPYGERIKLVVVSIENSEDPVEDIPEGIENLNAIITEIDTLLSSGKSDEEVTEIPIQREGKNEPVDIPIHLAGNNEESLYTAIDEGEDDNSERPIQSKEKQDGSLESDEITEQELTELESRAEFMERYLLETRSKIAEARAKKDRAENKTGQEAA